MKYSNCGIETDFERAKIYNFSSFHTKVPQVGAFQNSPKYKDRSIKLFQLLTDFILG